jgi:hypothetical protein
MQYTLIHVCVGDHVLDHEAFFNKKEAVVRVQELSREKVWRLGDAVYFGDVYIKMFDLDTHVTSEA